MCNEVTAEPKCGLCTDVSGDAFLSRFSFEFYFLKHSKKIAPKTAIIWQHSIQIWFLNTIALPNFIQPQAIQIA